MAIPAADVALWDLKARLLGVCLADALPRYRERVAIYGSGGCCNYSDAWLREHAQGWVDEGFRSGMLTPDRSRPGLGLELKRDEAARYAV